MTRFSRRAFIAGGVTLTAASAGCLSGGEETAEPTEAGGGGETTTEAGGGGEMTAEPTESGSIAETTPPSGEQSLPTPVAGDPDADVTVAVYEDYACPHCKTYSVQVFPQIANEYLESGTIRYEFHDFPIPVDQTLSYEAANAARAVQANLGSQAFFEYSEKLFRNQRSLNRSTYASLAGDFDVDGATVRQAATEQRYQQTIDEDRQGGVDRGVRGTPTVFVDGSPVEWREIAYQPVKDAIENARSG